MKGPRVVRPYFGISSANGESSHSLIPLILAGGALGSYMGVVDGPIDMSRLRQYVQARNTPAFLTGIAVGMGIGYILYPWCAPTVDNLITWLYEKVSWFFRCEDDCPNNGWFRCARCRNDSEQEPNEA
ncbi:hypothetical protein X943_002687 [Babesia divergens]|uniref:Uncharacterized protein n=1 Tax=Babesia divergens TaxID=32595 RepID=A0AAD9LL24_BABDI|nr:hypothetical protein X943_002687 [Babesia divergens]